MEEQATSIEVSGIDTQQNNLLTTANTTAKKKLITVNTI